MKSVKESNLLSNNTKDSTYSFIFKIITKCYSLKDNTKLPLETINFWGPLAIDGVTRTTAAEALK